MAEEQQIIKNRSFHGTSALRYDFIGIIQVVLFIFPFFDQTAAIPRLCIEDYQPVESSNQLIMFWTSW